MPEGTARKYRVPVAEDPVGPKANPSFRRTLAAARLRRGAGFPDPGSVVWHSTGPKTRQTSIVSAFGRHTRRYLGPAPGYPKAFTRRFPVAVAGPNGLPEDPPSAPTSRYIRRHTSHSTLHRTMLPGGDTEGSRSRNTIRFGCPSRYPAAFPDRSRFEQLGLGTPRRSWLLNFQLLKA